MILGQVQYCQEKYSTVRESTVLSKNVQYYQEKYSTVRESTLLSKKVYM
jgi:hypothetical protein